MKIQVKQKKLNKTAAEEKKVVIALGGLKVPVGARKHPKLKGRGSGSGHGKTSTRGSKGQTSRSGRDFYLGFEGGQSPLIRRVAKRGFNNKFKKVYQVVNLEDAAKIKDAVITPALLWEKGVVKHKSQLVKILGDGELKEAKTFQAHAFSKSAVEKITKAGGKVEVVNA